MTRSGRYLSSYSSSTSAADPPEAAAADSDFILILAALLCAVICVVGLIAVARCAWLRRGSATSGGAPASANRGLKKKVVQSLPKLIFSSAEMDGKIPTECAICLAEYSDGNEIRILPQCGHVFHVGCVDTWLGSHSSCPSCRQILVVTRCRKCGEVPAETEMKMRQDGGAAAATSASSGEFLP